MVLDENDQIIETSEGILCEVAIGPAEEYKLAYLTRETLGMEETSDNLEDKENLEDFNTAGTSGKGDDLITNRVSPAIPSSSAVILPGTSNKATASIKWTDSQTKKMLALYNENVVKVGPMKKFRNKKLMWECIATDISNEFKIYVSGIQCESRFKNVLKRKTGAVKHNKQSGNDPVEVPYQDEIDEIKSMDDSIKPEVLVSPGSIKVLKNNSQKCLAEQSRQDNKKKKTEDPLITAFRESQERREANRQRRHEEKLALLREFLSKKE
ncbi:uncharacterized protein LOC112457083 [Temnothorax curvispinosus]|uniref:Uncharacterized protein LOC112457083 n=1 Tax=Temnothorax curvispinosus TaxID=300111 RepID=A0A6J1Q2L9_9HYME|nr:uncharacterized protein LOC112457083 [Temnothorax curvispinosus]